MWSLDQVEVTVITCVSLVCSVMSATASKFLRVFHRGQSCCFGVHVHPYTSLVSMARRQLLPANAMLKVSVKAFSLGFMCVVITLCNI